MVVCKYLIINVLRVFIGVELSYLGVIVASRLRVLYGVVLGGVLDVLKWSKSLIINMLNYIYIVAAVIKYEYLCIAKVPYYGRSTFRHRAHDNASPIRDAAGSRSIISKGWSIV